jgi:hypothetical protein
VRSPRDPSGSEPPHDPGWIGSIALAAGLLAFFAVLYPIKGFHFPVGPDAPVYLWWTRLAGHDGLSAVGTRPGVPALALVLARTLHVSLAEALTGIGVAGGVCVGLASAALVERASDPAVPPGRRRVRAIAAGALAGTFAAHLADGYFANLWQAGLFLGAVACIARPGRMGVAWAAVLLAASAVSHPQFFALGVGILLLTASLTILRRPPHTRLVDTEGARIVGAVAGGGLLAGAGFAALTIGPSAPRVDTSQDAFLRRAGLTGLLRRQYRGRFVRHLARYVLEVQVPLGIVGLRRSGGFLARFLATWSAVLVVGVAGSLATGLVPAVRFFASAYVLPILAALGLVVAAGWIARRNRVLGAVVGVGLAAAIVLGAAFTWLRAEPFMSTTELSRAATAGRIAEEISPPGTPVVVIVENQHRNVAFLVTRANNVLRDAFPTGRIRDVFVYVGSPERYLQGLPTFNGPSPHDAMSRLYLEDIRRAGGQPLAFVLAPFNRDLFDRARVHGDLVSRGVVLLRPHPTLTGPPPAVTTPDDAPRSSGWGLALAATAAVGLLIAIGFGWARTFVAGPTAFALSPVLGAGAIVVAAIAVERLGAPLDGWGSPLVSAAVGVGGYVALLVTRRRPGVDLREQPGAVGEPPGEIP